MYQTQLVRLHFKKRHKSKSSSFLSCYALKRCRQSGESRLLLITYAVVLALSLQHRSTTINHYHTIYASKPRN